MSEESSVPDDESTEEADAPLCPAGPDESAKHQQLFKRWIQLLFLPKFGRTLQIVHTIHDGYQLLQCWVSGSMDIIKRTLSSLVHQG